MTFLSTYGIMGAHFLEVLNVECYIHERKHCPKCKKFSALMKEIEAPSSRELATESNVSWFLRQGIAYHNHPKFIEAREAAVACLR